MTKMNNDLSLKKKVFLFIFKLRQFLHFKWVNNKKKAINFIDSLYFYFIFFCGVIFLIHKSLVYSNLTISENNIYSFAFAIASIIGASIAIIFSFSTFILQSTSDLFSTQYLNKFIENTKEKIFFWLLVILTIGAFSIPVISLPNSLIKLLPKHYPQYYRFEFLISIFLIAFYLIYSLFRELRKKINPESTLIKIKIDALKQLEKINRELKKHANFQNKIFEYEKENKDFSLDIQYKRNPNWHLLILENVKYLFEIGLRLMAKNEINSFNLILKFIRDIYLKHLDLRNGSFIRMPASFWGTNTFDDEGFTTQILEYLQSIGNRIVEEKRKENIYFLLKIYESIVFYSLNIKFADKDLNAHKDNPLLNIVIAYYVSFIDQINQSKENDWTWKSIESISNVSNITLQKTDNRLLCIQLNQTIFKISNHCFINNEEAFLKEIANLYFKQIGITWNKYEHNNFFWENLFKELKKNILLISTIRNPILSVGELFMNFQSWQVNVANWIFELEDDKEQIENLNKYIKLIKRWSNFLLDLGRDMGLNNQKTGFAIVQSIDDNLRIIYGIKNKFKDINFEKLYKTQFNTLSWYFQKTTEVDWSYSFNLEQVLEILLKEIRNNLKEVIFNVDYLIDLYIRLIEQHFEKATIGFGYNHPRIIEKLVYLGLILNKYKQKQERNIVAKIDELNKNYLELNKEYFDLKQEEKNLMKADEYQLCKEIHELENDLFSYNNNLMDMKNILKQEITKKEWDDFVGKIDYCKNIKYKTEIML